MGLQLFIKEESCLDCNFQNPSEISERDCTICLVKAKALISFTVTVKLVCIFVFAYAKRRFSHEAAHNCVCDLSRLMHGAVGSL